MLSYTLEPLWRSPRCASFAHRPCIPVREARLPKSHKPVFLKHGVSCPNGCLLLQPSAGFETSSSNMWSPTTRPSRIGPDAQTAWCPCASKVFDAALLDTGVFRGATISVAVVSNVQDEGEPSMVASYPGGGCQFGCPAVLCGATAPQNLQRAHYQRNLCASGTSNGPRREFVSTLGHKYGAWNRGNCYVCIWRDVAQGEHRKAGGIAQGEHRQAGGIAQGEHRKAGGINPTVDTEHQGDHRPENRTLRAEFQDGVPGPERGVPGPERKGRWSQQEGWRPDWSRWKEATVVVM